MKRFMIKSTAKGARNTDWAESCGDLIWTDKQGGFGGWAIVVEKVEVLREFIDQIGHEQSHHGSR